MSTVCYSGQFVTQNNTTEIGKPYYRILKVKGATFCPKMWQKNSWWINTKHDLSVHLYLPCLGKPNESSFSGVAVRDENKQGMCKESIIAASLNSFLGVVHLRYFIGETLESHLLKMIKGRFHKIQFCFKLLEVLKEKWNAIFQYNFVL